ncbi:hypothetical protein [Vitiosangium sp. GDMCC 1.1324]|uniref:hypothetical protein n=1 Tax=Vitiosangium sp. (strain GDMCC 1.1324) TaxID=2138576 RepID=UPI000D36D528|nr:hypothetical protein [Vitiosangium sp. GDMCC 1.1324]PTL78056.1 hypothetical protein DAT35_41290 [Vitiosangium sp. GDMCC 1.1324]
MGYRVRTPEGELGYPTLLDVEKAYTQGLVAPDDEVLEDGHSTWRKASSIPALARARPPSTGLMGRAQKAGVVAALVLGAAALRLILSDSWSRRGAGIVLALAMSSVLMWLTVSAARRPAPRKD